jgi:hypothetical protein
MSSLQGAKRSPPAGNWEVAAPPGYDLVSMVSDDGSLVRRRRRWGATGQVPSILARLRYLPAEIAWTAVGRSVLVARLALSVQRPKPPSRAKAWRS